MTKIKAPLFSLDAAGTLDKNITYKKKLQNNIAQKYATPGSKNPFESSPRQKDQRSIIRLITIHWQCMTAIDKLAWENAAKDARFKGTGYHYFLHLAQTNLTQYLGLIGYWSMNYNIGDKIPDLSGNGNHGTLSPFYPCDSPTLVDSINKKQGKAAKFDGINDYINCGVSSFFDIPSTLTLSALIKPLGVPAHETSIIGKDAYNQYELKYTSAGSIYIVVHTTAGFYSSPISSLPLNKWSLFFGVFNSITNKITGYLNGNENIVSNNTLGTITPLIFRPIYIGKSRPFVTTFNGLVDNITIYNICLSPQEILKIYQSYNLP